MYSFQENSRVLRLVIELLIQVYNYRHTTACSQIYITGTAPMATYDDARTATDELVRKIEVSISINTLACNPALRAYKFVSVHASYE